LCDAILAAFLLSATWDDLYEFLGLPVPKPAFYAQLLGAALVALAILEWSIAGRQGAREVAGGVAVGSALAAAILATWLLTGRTTADVHGEIILWFVTGFLLLEAVLHARSWRRGRPSKA
jgi:CDP-diglyceride synthetase